MPIYEYDCQKCHKRTEVIQAYSDPALKICPHCGGKKLKKAISAPAIQFKGSGFYVTDYGKGDSGPRKKESEPSGKSESASDSSSKTENKTEKKTDSGGGEGGKTGGEKKTEAPKKKGKKGE